MNIKLRPALPEDAATCGRICYEAFKTISEQHNFTPDIPSAEVAAGWLTELLTHPNCYGVVAETDGRIIGSNFLDERASVVGLGPITVDPEAQNAQVGRKLMEHMLERAWSHGRAGVCLVQAAFHNRSLSLYTKLGFDVREPLSCIQGNAANKQLPGYHVRRAIQEDLGVCNDVCRRILGYDRERELSDAIQAGTATVVEHDGRISGYTTQVGFAGHAVGSSNNDLMALISAAPEYPGPGFLLPTRNGELLRWCLAEGLRVMQPMTYMSIGTYSEPEGAYLPSILL